MPIYDDFASPQFAYQPYQSQGRDAGRVLRHFTILPWHRYSKGTHLHEYKLGRARDAPKESVEYRQYLLSNFEGRKYYEWEFPERGWLLRNIQKSDMWEREQ
jgi:hypothetical protein